MNDAKTLENTTDVELEQMIIDIIKTENDYLMRRIYGCIKKEIDILKNDIREGRV